MRTGQSAGVVLATIHGGAAMTAESGALKNHGEARGTRHCGQTRPAMFAVCRIAARGRAAH